jgi:predicted dehydrogenase
MGSLRIGLLSAASYGYMGAPRVLGSSHGTGFATAMNGFDATKRDVWPGTFEPASRRIPGARVVTVWDPLPEAAAALATLCGIERVCETLQEACEGVDAVMVVDDGSGQQWRHAVHPLARGIPTFCDKPLGMTASEAREVAATARANGAKLMTGSSLRFVPDIVRLRQELPDLGEVHLVTVACHNELMYYGTHALSMAYALFGAGAVSCVNVGSSDVDIIRIRHQACGDIVLVVGRPEHLGSGYQIDLYGQQGWRTVRPDLTDAYANLVETFLGYVSSGVAPFEPEEEVEIVAVLEAGQRSLREGGEVSLAEVLG